MSDLIPADKIAAVALRYARSAHEKVMHGAYGHSEAREAQTFLIIATELLALIAAPDDPGPVLIEPDDPPPAPRFASVRGAEPEDWLATPTPAPPPMPPKK
jgi:hypothetical protein